MKHIALLISMALSSSMLFSSCGAILSGLTGSASRQEIAVETRAPEFQTSDFAEFEIVREDRSFRDEASGKTLIEVYYDRVEIASTVPGAESINQQVDAACESFLSRRDGLEEYLEYTDPSTDYSFFCASTAEVTHNGGGLICIKSSTAWFMGGVSNCDQEGMTFDLETGALLTLADLCPEKEGQIREIALSWMEENYGDQELGDRDETLAQYSLTEIPFYIQNGQIVLAFPTYTFASGAAGPTIIETGLYIGD